MFTPSPNARALHAFRNKRVQVVEALDKQRDKHYSQGITAVSYATESSQQRDDLHPTTGHR